MLQIWSQVNAKGCSLYATSINMTWFLFQQELVQWYNLSILHIPNPSSYHGYGILDTLLPWFPVFVFFPTVFHPRSLLVMPGCIGHHATVVQSLERRVPSTELPSLEGPATHLCLVLIACRSYEKKRHFTGPPWRSGYTWGTGTGYWKSSATPVAFLLYGWVQVLWILGSLRSDSTLFI